MKRTLYHWWQRCLFALPPELSHQYALASLSLIPDGLLPHCAKDPVELMGLPFNNRVGIAAGLDKNAYYLSGLERLGVGHIEVGTVTPQPQEGNPRPRLFRLPQNHAVINRMGFNNEGVDALVARVSAHRRRNIIGINIGKNKLTPNELALYDYLYCFSRVYCVADYVTVNISSPNTPLLRELQYGRLLEELLAALKTAQSDLASVYGRYVPLVVKIAPDMTSAECQETARLLLAHGIEGVIATNTTLARPATCIPEKNLQQEGGLSGAPLKAASLEILDALAPIVQGKMSIISVGGIMTSEDIQERLRRGADLVQVYTGLLYNAPELLEPGYQ